MPSPDPRLSAQVVLRPERGDPGSPVTAATLPDHVPDRRIADRVAAHFRSQGFEVGDLVAISFAITAPRSRFEHAFGVPLSVDEDARGHVARVSTTSGGFELPLSRLPGDVAEQLQAVTFTPPPDFGPGSFM